MEVIDEIIIETHNLTTIHNLCDDARENHKMIGIVSPAGYGKTTALISYARKHNDCVIMVKALKSANARLFYSSIYNENDDENYNPGLPLYFSLRKAAQRLIGESKNMLLIIDEAGKFTPTMLEYLHEFRDLTKGNTGIVLSGVEYFRDNLENWNLRKKNGMPEVYSRINAWQELAPPTYDEIIAIIRAYDISDKGLEKSCRSVSDYRQLTNIIKNYKVKQSRQLNLSSISRGKQ